MVVVPPARTGRAAACGRHRSRAAAVPPAAPIVVARPGAAGAVLPGRPSVLPIAPLVTAPLVAIAIAVVHKDAGARIIIIAVPAEGIISAVAVAAVGITVTVAAITDADRQAAGRISVPVPAVAAIAVRIAVHVISAAGERDASDERESSKLQSSDVHTESPILPELLECVGAHASERALNFR